MAIIHNQKLDSEFIYDKWAVINFAQEFEDKKQHLSESDYTRLNELIVKFKNIDMQKLPHAFTHGDIISTNVMKDNNGKLWIIDFAVSNYVPRIVDLAVSSCNLCLNPESIKETRDKTKMILKEYEKYNKLTSYEKEVFPIFFDIANAMGILQISYLISQGEASEEDKFWYNESQKGLEFSDKEFWNDILGKEEIER